MGNYLWSAFILHKITPIIMKNIISLSPCQLCSWEAEKLLLCVRRQLTLVGDTTQLPSGDITRPAGGVLTGPQTCRRCCAILRVSEKATTSAFTSTHTPRQGFVGRQCLKTGAMFFGPTAQTRRLRQPRPAAAADQNIQFSSKFGRWGCWKSKESGE